LVETALDEPIGIPKLSIIARHKHSVVIVTADKTRGVPSRITFPFILRELRAAGVGESSVKLLVATGLHKGETMNDVRERLGSEVPEGLEVIIHDSDDKDQLASLGKLSSGTPLLLSKAVVDSDLIVVEGVVEPHFFAGFTGGSKMILPGLAGSETIMRNHGWHNIDDPRSRSGVIRNPVRAEANEALHHLGPIFSINLAVDNQKRIVFANSGEMLASFVSAAEQVILHSKIQVTERPDVVLTTNGGYPLDRNFYQCVKGIAVPEEVVHEKSRIIMAGECGDGIAHRDFLKLMQSGTPAEIYGRMKSSDAPVCDQWQAQILCRILNQNQVWFVTRNELKSDIESTHMHYASTIEEALDTASLTAGEHILAVPEGPGVILKPAEQENGTDPTRDILS
jgi:nickel-dependent lactate racemase